MSDKRKDNGRKPGICQAIHEDGSNCLKQGENVELIHGNRLLRVKLCAKCGEGLADE